MKYFTAIFLAGFLVVSSVSAQSTDSAKPLDSARQSQPAKTEGVLQKVRSQLQGGVKADTQGEVKALQEGVRKEIENAQVLQKEAQEEIKNQIQAERRVMLGSTTLPIAKERIELFFANREKLQQQISEQREAFKNTITDLREGAQEQIAAKKIELREKLSGIKDEAKRNAAQGVFEKLNGLKEKRIGVFEKAITQIEEVLGRIVSRSEKVAAGGGDIKSVSAAVETAKKSIAEARAFVELGAAEVYTVATTTEANLKSDFTKVRNEFGDDMKKVEEKVKAARDAVHAAATALAKIPNADQYEVESSTTSTQEQ